MTRPGMRWRHVIINTLCSWLHGDERGFRSRRHRIHSSGDYRNPPPEGEHAGLRKYHEERSREEVTVEKELRKAVGVAIMRHLLDEGYRVLAIAVGKVHTHGLMELPENLRRVKAIVGHAKRKSSRAVKKELPGKVRAAGGTYKLVERSGHLERAFGYILYDQGADAWTWSFRDRSGEGMFRRKRPAIAKASPVSRR